MLDDAGSRPAAKTAGRGGWCIRWCACPRWPLLRALADRLILLNETDRDFALGRRWKAGSARSTWCRTGVSTAFLAQAPPRDAPRGRGILFCGSWAAGEGRSLTWLPRFRQWWRADVRTNLTVLGGAMPDETIRSAFRCGRRPYVTIVERVPESEVMDAYRTHDVLAVAVDV